MSSQSLTTQKKRAKKVEPIRFGIPHVVSGVLDLASLVAIGYLLTTITEVTPSALNIALFCIPMLIGLVVGWANSLTLRRPFSLWPAGLVVTAAVMIIGSILSLFVTGFLFDFDVILGIAVLAPLCFLGWRLFGLLVRYGFPFG